MVIRNKKAISIMIGYILLVSMAVAISIFVYSWVKTYVPRDLPDCPDGTSLSIKNVSCVGLNLDLILENNGRFNIAGYFIHATEIDNPEILATVDLSSKISSGGTALRNSILFAEGDSNSMIPNEERAVAFVDLTSQIYTIEITPLRFQEEENRKRLVSCGEAKTKETVSCN